MHLNIYEQLVLARDALLRLENSWVSRMNKALADQRNLVKELEQRYWEQRKADKEKGE